MTQLWTILLRPHLLPLVHGYFQLGAVWRSVSARIDGAVSRVRLRDDRMGACRVATLLVGFGKRLIFLLLFVKLLDDMLAFELVLIGVDSSAGELLL